MGFLHEATCHDSSSSLFGFTNTPFRVSVIASSLRRSCLLMANQAPVVPDAQQLQEALAVPLAQAGAARDAQNVDGGEQPAAVAQVTVPPAQTVPEPNAEVVNSPCLLLARFSFSLLSAASVVFFAERRSSSVPFVSFLANMFLRVCLVHGVSVTRFYSKFVAPLCCFGFLTLFVVVTSLIRNLAVGPCLKNCSSELDSV